VSYSNRAFDDESYYSAFAVLKFAFVKPFYDVVRLKAGISPKLYARDWGDNDADNLWTIGRAFSIFSSIEFGWKYVWLGVTASYTRFWGATFEGVPEAIDAVDTHPIYLRLSYPF
jgi:hypothetical protein